MFISIDLLDFLTKRKIHFRAKIFREKTSHSEAKKKKKENTKPYHQGISKRAFKTTKPSMQSSIANGCGSKARHQRLRTHREP